jgi:hypothetical protein
MAVCYALTASGVSSSQAAPLPAEWQHEQRFAPTAPGLVKLSLPPATLDAARPALEDLRLYDDAGLEVPYLIERPKPAGKITQAAKSFEVSMSGKITDITIETGLDQPIDGVTLQTPALAFLKAVQIAGSTDGRNYRTLAWGQPIFREPGGASQLYVAVPAGVWKRLRFDVIDQRSQPIPFTGASVHAAQVEPVPAEGVPITITGREEHPGESRLTLNLGAANLDLADIQIDTSEPLFTRAVTVSVRHIAEDALREQPLAQGVVYRVSVENQPPSGNLIVPVESPVHSRELLLLIKNQDSPPLPITGVRVERRPVYLVFLARAAGPYHLLTGNNRCAAPRYDLAYLGANLKSVGVSPLQPSPLADNPRYRAPEVLAGIQEGGTALDVSAWKFRKAVKLSRAGAQRIELDLDVLSHAQPSFSDLRLLRDGKQLPYILEPTSISRSLTPSVTPATDKKDPTISRWIIKLPHSGLPLTHLNCLSRTSLFQRVVALYEELSDDRGDHYRRPLGGASWFQTPDATGKQLMLTFDASPTGDTLVLETHNGDNPAIELEKFQAYYPTTRMLFKAQSSDALMLYYGNPKADAPRYDLSLVANQLLAADQAEAPLAAEEQLKKSWGDGHRPGQGGIVFWGVLAVVVVALLIIISRLLPQSPKPE